MSETHAGQVDATFESKRGARRWAPFLSLSGLTLALSIIGAGVAGYLTYVHYDESALVCTVGGGCHTVQQSDYATIGPIPIAMLGLGMFGVLAALSVSRMLEWSVVSSDTATMMSWGITLSAIIYYAYLVYVEIFVLEAICQWCVVTTVITIAIFAIESFRLRSALEISEEDLID